MTPERWSQIERIYHAALERDERQRSLYLQETCQSDEELRKEVESLLARPNGRSRSSNHLPWNWQRSP